MTKYDKIDLMNIFPDNNGIPCTAGAKARDQKTRLCIDLPV